ncbi:MAG TPA: hypothetical protein VFA33_22520 [Bryobacteraceae bacterium]|nr:hypothetical protein [Bryobacteraceae bacterium]
MIKANDLGQLTELAMDRIDKLDATRAEREECIQRKANVAAELTKQEEEERAIALDQRRMNGLANTWGREASEAVAKLLDEASRNPACDFDSVADLCAKARMKPKLGAEAVTFIVTRLMPAQRVKVLELELAHAREHEQVLLYDALIARIEAAIAVQGLLDVEGSVEISGGRSEYLLRLALDAGRRTRAAHQNLIDEKSRQAEMARSGAIASL